eukprot:COSAG01_NODE_28646_length_656_cov_1.134650_2_plen_93_part_01
MRWATALTPHPAEDNESHQLAEQYHQYQYHPTQGPPSNALGLLLMPDECHSNAFHTVAMACSEAVAQAMRSAVSRQGRTLLWELMTQRDADSW